MPVTDMESCARTIFTNFTRPNNPGPEAEGQYRETGWLLLSAAMIQRTGLPNYNAVFRRYLADPIGMGASATMSWPSVELADPGAALFCTSADYSLFMTKVYSGELMPAGMQRLMEEPITTLMGIHSRGHAVNYWGSGWRGAPRSPARARAPALLAHAPALLARAAVPAVPMPMRVHVPS